MAKIDNAPLDRYGAMHEVAETFAGQSHLICLDRYEVGEEDYFQLTSRKLPEGFYSFAEVEIFTTRTPYMRDGKCVGESVQINLGDLIVEEVYDNFREAFERYTSIVSEVACDRIANGA